MLDKAGKKKAVLASMKYQRLHPERHRAGKAVRRALNAGKLERPSCCSSCGCECKPEAHHPDYSRPLDVVWLCLPCHRNEHPRLPRLPSLGDIAECDRLTQDNWPYARLLTLAEASRALGVSRPTLRRWESSIAGFPQRRANRYFVWGQIQDWMEEGETL